VQLRVDTDGRLMRSQVIRKKIPIRIKNVENPSGGGTVIHPEPEVLAQIVDADQLLGDADGFLAAQSAADGDAGVTPPAGSPLRSRRPKLPTAVTIKERILVLNIHSNRKSVSHGFLAGIFGTLDRFGVVVDLISTSEVHVSMAIEGGGLGESGGIDRRVLERLVKDLRKIGTVRGCVIHQSSCWLTAPRRSTCTRTWQFSRSWARRCETWSASQAACSLRWHKAT
jgi:aspartate kinase